MTKRFNVVVGGYMYDYVGFGCQGARAERADAQTGFLGSIQAVCSPTS